MSPEDLQDLLASARAASDQVHAGLNEHAEDVATAAAGFAVAVVGMALALAGMGMGRSDIVGAVCGMAAKMAMEVTE